MDFSELLKNIQCAQKNRRLPLHMRRLFRELVGSCRRCISDYGLLLRIVGAVADVDREQEHAMVGKGLDENVAFVLGHWVDDGCREAILTSVSPLG